MLQKLFEVFYKKKVYNSILDHILSKTEEKLIIVYLKSIYHNDTKNKRFEDFCSFK